MADTPSVEKIQKDLEDLKCHIKTYSTGAYPAFFLQLHSVLKIQDILDMELADVYFCEEGQIKLLPEIIYAGEKIILDPEERMELAWYVNDVGFRQLPEFILEREDYIQRNL